MFRQTADVVVALDNHGFFVFAATRLNHIRVNSALGQPRRAFDTATPTNAFVKRASKCFYFMSTLSSQGKRLCLKYLYKFTTNNFSFGLRIAHTSELSQKLGRRIHPNHPGMQFAGKHVHHHVAFVQAQQTMVNKNAGQLVTNGAMNQGRSHRRVHTSREAQNHFFVTDLGTDLFHRLADVVAHDPVGPCTADAKHKALQNRCAA
ncbi:hypothetical protein GALL_449220 [mine drainage metagenome]|uniref:Uncharacterized protein n=1 Tax=mine drainage metagenome TaxID=410659 RepID=A0A1J5Q092_9ZZZZ